MPRGLAEAGPGGSRCQGRLVDAELHEVRSSRRSSVAAGAGKCRVTSTRRAPWRLEEPVEMMPENLCCGLRAVPADEDAGAQPRRRGESRCAGRCLCPGPAYGRRPGSRTRWPGESGSTLLRLDLRQRSGDARAEAAAPPSGGPVGPARPHRARTAQDDRGGHPRVPHPPPGPASADRRGAELRPHPVACAPRGAEPVSRSSPAPATGRRSIMRPRSVHACSSSSAPSVPAPDAWARGGHRVTPRTDIHCPHCTGASGCSRGAGLQ